MANNLSRQLQQWADELLEDVEKGIVGTEKVIETTTKNGAPVQDGFLRQSIQGRHLSQYHSRVAIGAEYAPFVIYGTGVFATQGSRANKIPWTYYSDSLGRFVTTFGQRPQDFWTPGLLAGERYFNSYFK